MSDNVVLINPFVVPQGQLDEAITYWEACREFLSRQPGYVSTTLHQAISQDSTFQLVNVAEWESEKAFFDAVTKLKPALNLPSPLGLFGDPALYSVIRH